MRKEGLNPAPIKPENGRAKRGRKKGESPLDTVDLAIWNYAVRSDDILVRIKNSKLLTEDELDKVQNYFERQKGAKKPSIDLLGKFSLGV